MKISSDTSSRLSTLLDTKYWEFFVPTILMAMTLTMSIVVDSIIVGNMLGARALSAVNLVLPMVMVYNTVAVCLGLGAATLISVAKGRRDPDTVNTVFTAAFCSMLAIGLLMLAGQVATLDGITRLLTGEPSLRPLVKSYLHVLVYGTPLIVMVPGLAYCLRVDAQVRLASTILIVSNLVNLALDLVYMGPLQMGIAGSSLATVSGYVIGACCLLPYLFSNKRSLHFKSDLLTALPALFRTLGTIVKTGFPAAMGSILITFKILCINHIVLAVKGPSALVAFSVCLSCLSFVSMFISGAAQTMTPIVGVLYGEKDYRGVYFVVRRAFITLMIASIAATLLLEAVPGQILGLFGVHGAADIAEGIPAIRIFSLSLIGTSTTFLSMYYYMTIGHTKISTAISIVQGAAVVPIALAMSQLIGVSGVWAAFSVAEIVTILMIAACFSHMKRKSPQKYSSPLLLDREQLPGGHRLETTSNADEEAIRETVRRITGFIGDLGIAPKTAEAVPAAIRATTAVIFSPPSLTGKSQYVDIGLHVQEDKIIVTLRDNGKNVSQRGDTGLAQSLAETCQVTYAQAIGFNNHTLTFSR